MGELFEAVATLRFFGDDLEPDHVPAVLGARPTSSLRRGDPLTPGRDGRERRAHTGSRRLHAGRRAPGNLDALVHGLLNGLSDDLEAWIDLTRRFESDSFFGLFVKTGNEGVSLSRPRFWPADGGDSRSTSTATGTASTRPDAGRRPIGARDTTGSGEA